MQKMFVFFHLKAESVCLVTYLERCRQFSYSTLQYESISLIFVILSFYPVHFMPHVFSQFYSFYFWGSVGWIVWTSFHFVLLLAFNVVMDLAHKILIYTTYSTFVLDFLTFPVVFVSDVFLVLLLSIHTLWCQFVFITHFLSQMILIYQRFCN